MAARAPRTPARTLAEAVASEDARTQLEGLREALVADLEATDPRYRAPLYSRLVDVLDRLGKMPAKEASPLDDLAARRAARLADSDAPKRPAAAGDKRRGGG